MQGVFDEESKRIAHVIAARHLEGVVYSEPTAYFRPMIRHAEEVVETVAEFHALVGSNLPLDFLEVVAKLHDVFEDSTIGRAVAEKEVLTSFGEDTHLVVGLLSNLEAKSRRESMRMTLLRIREDPRAVLVKLADRYRNQHETIRGGSVRHARLYRGEFDMVVEILRPVAPYPEIWRLLEEQAVALQRMIEPSPVA